MKKDPIEQGFFSGFGGNNLQFAQIFAEPAIVGGQIEYVGKGPHISLEEINSGLPFVVGIGTGHVFYRLQDDCGGESSVAVELGAVGRFSVFSHGLHRWKCGRIYLYDA